MPSELPQIIIRATAEQRDAWKRAADADSRSLSNWLTLLADAAAKKQAQKVACK